MEFLVIAFAIVVLTGLVYLVMRRPRPPGRTPEDTPIDPPDADPS